MEETVKAEECPVHIDTVRRSAPAAEGSQGFVLSALLADLIDCRHQFGFPEIEIPLTKRPGKELERALAKCDHLFAFRRTIAWQQDIQGFHGLLQPCVVSEHGGIKKGKLLSVEILRDRFCAPKIQDPELAVFHQEVPGMRVGVKGS